MGMWNIPLALFNAESQVTLYCTVSELVGDLFTWLGSPAVPNNYNIIVDGCHLGDIQISLDFPVGTTFQFSCINNGAIMGLGGDGGDGGFVGGGVPLPTVNNHGTPGTAAITSNTFDVSIDIDDGYLLGGGGGGGGGAAITGPVAGGGGGGGAGFAVSAGGNGGDPEGGPIASPGVNGGDLGPGAGGEGGGAGAAGGTGGTWGAGGITGDSDAALTLLTSFWLNGGSGGAGGNAFLPSPALNGAEITFNGSKSEAVLRNENRLMGETAFRIFLGSESRNDLTYPNPTTGIGPVFNNNGSGVDGAGVFGNWIIDEALFGFPNAAGNGDDYQVRASSRPNTSYFNAGGWDTTPGADGTYFVLTSDRGWTADINSAGAEIWVQLFEIQRTGRPADEIIDSFWYLLINTSA